MIILGGGTKKRQERDINAARAYWQDYKARKRNSKRGIVMVLTRNFRKTVQARAKRDPAYREAMLTEAVDSFLSGDVEVGKAILRDYINATIGFEALSRQLDKSSKSLHRMLSPSGNPKTSNFFEILRFLQRNEVLELVVTARHHTNGRIHGIAT